MSIVWPCTISVECYLAAGRDIEVTRPDCPGCAQPMWFWSGYHRFIRSCSGSVKLWVRRAWCSGCHKSHSLLPSFVLKGRLDVVGSIGQVLSAVAEGTSGVRPAASQVGVPHSTARDWVRRLTERSADWIAGFSALVVRLGGELVDLAGSGAQQALTALRSAFTFINPGRSTEHLWPFASLITGGGLLATNSNPPWLVVGNRRFIAPVPESPG